MNNGSVTYHLIIITSYPFYLAVSKRYITFVLNINLLEINDYGKTY